jgi:hypothetical protein
MEEKNPDIKNKPDSVIKPDMKCRVCGSFLYATDHGNHETTYHCSSKEARFWDFERGTPEEVEAKEHWEKSRTEVVFKER